MFGHRLAQLIEPVVVSVAMIASAASAIHWLEGILAVLAASGSAMMGLASILTVYMRLRDWQDQRALRKFQQELAKKPFAPPDDHDTPLEHD